jgi:hypothetical protein
LTSTRKKKKKKKKKILKQLHYSLKQKLLFDILLQKNACNSAVDKRLPYDTVLSNGSSLDSLSTTTGVCVEGVVV